MVKVEKVKEVAKEITVEFQEKLTVLMTTALGVVAALFWQDAIKDMIHAFIPPSDAWQYEILAATIVTFFAVVALYLLSRIGKEKEMYVQRT